MKTPTWLRNIGLASLITMIPLGFSAAPSFSQSSNTEQVTFFCHSTFDRASGEQIPATIAWIPETGKNIRLIGWKSNFFDTTLSAEERCEKVSQKFQDFYNQGYLNYLTVGQSGGYPIVCGVATPGEPCNGESQLFTLKPHSRPDLVLARLSDIFSGLSSDMLLQSSGQQVYISLETFFQNAQSEE